ncbi:MAG: hypothetical protein MMC33_002966 [Icmadophila ericetorum]|nr:hypothetical protein [Icmadophila ericetorum]
MASHSLAIAKASFSATFMRPDPTSVPREKIEILHDLLDRVLTQCSPTNIQRCKYWILEHAVSAAKVTSLGKYLAAVSLSLASTSFPHGPTLPKSQKPSARRKQLHILYLLSDVLHHSKFHGGSTAAFSTFSDAFQPSVLDLLRAAGAYDPIANRKHLRKVNHLLKNWEEQSYFAPPHIQKLRDTIISAYKDESAQEKQGLSFAGNDQEGKVSSTIQAQKDAPFIMPALHGDPSTPYYDLPAGNMMSHIIPNSAAPISSQLVKPLHLTPGPADETLASVVKGFLKDVDLLYGNFPAHEESAYVDADELGQPIFRDQTTGEIFGGEGYYGWSKAFCERMKRRRDGLNASPEKRGRSNSPGAWKRYSSSQSGRSRRSSNNMSRSGSRSRSRSLSWSRNRDLVDRRLDSMDRLHSDARASDQIPKGPWQRRALSRSRSPFENRAQAQRGRYQPRRSRSPSRSRSRTYSPPQRIPPPPQAPSTYHPIVRNEQGQQAARPPPQPFPRPFPQSMMLGPGGFPIPPPPPPGYIGAWPPPPPPLGPNPSLLPPGTSLNGFSGSYPPHHSQPFGGQESGIPQGPRHGHNGADGGGWGKQFNQPMGGTTNQYHGPSQPYPQYGSHGRGGRGWR